jgi:hypothetical protein
VGRSACSVITVPLELSLNVGHSAWCHSSNSLQTSSSCANWENLLQRHYWPCNKFKVMLHKTNPRFATGFPGLRLDRRRWSMTSAAGAFNILNRRNDWKSVTSDQRLTIVELEEEVGISRIHLCNSVHRFEDETCQFKVCSEASDHNIALNHTSFVQQFLTKKNIPVVTQPLYSLDLAPNDFWLFPTLIMGPKGTSNRMWQPNSGGFQTKPSTGASNNGRINGAWRKWEVCVRFVPDCPTDD